MADYLTTYKFPARRYVEGGLVRSQQTSTKVSICAGMNGSQSKYPGGEVLPEAYLGHRYGTCEHLSSNHNLSQAVTAGLPAKLS